MALKVKNCIMCILMLLYIMGIGVMLIIKNPKEFSYSERRRLAQRPEFSLDSFKSGDFAKEYESYILDQFPMRDNLRTLKAINEKYIFNKKDYNGIILEDGHLSKIEYPMRESMLEHACERFKNIYKKYLEDKNIKPYMVIVPDKNYYLGQDNIILTMNYDKLYGYVLDRTSYMTNIDIRNYLNINDYYQTDTHWRQEKIKDVAKVIANSMGIDIGAKYKKNVVEEQFYGVYATGGALPVKPDKLIYLTNDMLENCVVKCYDTGCEVEKEIYDIEKLTSKDMYDVFLSGAVALLTIENDKATSDKELIMIRDSFGSSLAPLLVEGYSKITMVDIRYIRSDMLDSFIEFNNQDVLFIYSTLLLNSSLGLK